MIKDLYPIFFIIFVATIWFNKSESLETNVPAPTISKTIVADDSTLIFLKDFEDRLIEGMNERKIPGGAVVITKGSSIIYQKGFGVKVKGTTDSVDVHTVFRLGSVSKGFASILTGIMVEDEILTWNDPIINHLPEFELNDPEQSKRVQINHLLSHTSGLPRHAYTNLIEDGLSLNRIIPRFKSVNLISEEGTQLAYQNAAYAIIEKVIEEHSDTSFGGTLKSQLFDPLGMNNTSTTYDDLIENKNKAMPHLYHSRRKGLLPASISKKYYNAISAGGINASIADMGNWLLMLTGNNPEVISDEILNEIFEPRATINNRRFSRYWDDVNESYYGLGWRVLNNDTQKVIYHGGYVNGFRSEIAFDKENQIGICILFNSPSSYALQVIPKFFNEFTPKNILPTETLPITE